MTTYHEDAYTQIWTVDTPFVETVHRGGGRALATTQRRMLFILFAVSVVVSLLFSKLGPQNIATSDAAVGQAEASAGAAAEPVDQDAPAAPIQVSATAAGALSPVFTAEVDHWAPKILEWAGAYGLDPNLVAIIMQIESCGDPQAVSHAGAQGLFQVMPFHFAAGENALDPETNARRGLNYFVERLSQTGGDIGRAFAGYNGGHRAAASSWDAWPAETQRYYKWSTGIHQDIQAGLEESPTLNAWLQAGGASLCRQAAGRLGLQ